MRSVIKRVQKQRHIGRRRARIMKKLDESKVGWIELKKRLGRMANRQTAESMRVSITWVKKLRTRYQNKIAAS